MGSEADLSERRLDNGWSRSHGCPGGSRSGCRGFGRVASTAADGGQGLEDPFALASIGVVGAGIGLFIGLDPRKAVGAGHEVDDGLGCVAVGREELPGSEYPLAGPAVQGSVLGREFDEQGAAIGVADVALAVGPDLGQGFALEPKDLVQVSRDWRLGLLSQLGFQLFDASRGCFKGFGQGGLGLSGHEMRRLSPGRESSRSPDRHVHC